jgi:hypothetical protein
LDVFAPYTIKSKKDQIPDACGGNKGLGFGTLYTPNPQHQRCTRICFPLQYDIGLAWFPKDWNEWLLPSLEVGQKVIQPYPFLK